MVNQSSFEIYFRKFKNFNDWRVNPTSRIKKKKSYTLVVTRLLIAIGQYRVTLSAFDDALSVHHFGLLSSSVSKEISIHLVSSTAKVVPLFRRINQTGKLVSAFLLIFLLTAYVDSSIFFSVLLFRNMTIYLYII